MLRTACYSLGALASLAVTAHAGVVINEVMYRPYNQLTFGRFEFTEVTNTDATPVDLSGAYFTDSQDFASICAGFEPHDHEGVFLIPSGTVVAPGGYLTFTHGGITGPNTVNYTVMQHLGNLVLNDGGDQVSLLRCSGTTPVVIDSFDYATLGLGETPANVSLERIDPSGPTQSAANWAFTLVPPGTNVAGEYIPGGTPGAQNSVTGGSCAISLAPYTLSPAFEADLSSANASDCDGCSLGVDAYSFACAGTPTLDDAVSAVFGDQEFASFPWVDSGTEDEATETSELAPYYDSIPAPLDADLGVVGEVPEIHEFRATFLVAPGAHEWRTAWIVLYPISHRIAVVQRAEDET